MIKSDNTKTNAGLEYGSFAYDMLHPPFRVIDDSGKLNSRWAEKHLQENELRLRELERLNRWSFDPTFGYIDEWHRKAGPRWWYPANRPEKKANQVAYAVGGLAAYAVLTKKSRKNVKYTRSDFFEWQWFSPAWKVNPFETAGAIVGLVVGVMSATSLSPAFGLVAIIGAFAYESHLDRASYAAISAHGL